MILVKTFFAYNELRNYSYLIYDQASGDSWVIDPFDARPIIEYIKKNNLSLKGILNTHQHFDHICGNLPLIETFGASVKKVNNSETIILDDEYVLEAIATPGHTMDHQAFLWKEKSIPVALFSGDTLFNAGVGNCRGGGDVSVLFETTKKLQESLGPKTLIYPGHDYRKRNLQFALSVEPENKEIQERLKELSGVVTEDLPPATIEDELKVNPFFRLNSPEIQETVLTRKGNERELFLKLRTLRDKW